MLALNADRMSFDQSNSVRIGDRESDCHISRIRLEPNILHLQLILIILK